MEKEKALLIGTTTGQRGEWEVFDSLEELSRLAETAGARVEKTIVQELKKIDASLLIGRGKAQEIRAYLEANPIDLVIFDDELTPTQQRNVETLFNTKTIDRTSLILDIFAQRAQSREGKLQVELAQLTYTLPRLRGKGTLLSRLGGGIGTRGPGETQLEVDRRKIKERISRVQRELEKARRVRKLHRLNRKSLSSSTVALIGYTNAGKSTLLNRLSRTRVPAEDRLFSTLDPKIGKIRLPNNQEVLITDTVGFIEKLPHQLIASFKATFEEVKASDVLLHLIDISNPHFENHIRAVNRVLAESSVSPAHIIHVLNKADRVSHKPMLRSWVKKLENGVAVSAVTGEGIDDLLLQLSAVVSEALKKVKLTIPFQDSALISTILSKGNIITKKYSATGIVIEAEISKALVDEVRPYMH